MGGVYLALVKRQPGQATASAPAAFAAAPGLDASHTLCADNSALVLSGFSVCKLPEAVDF